MRKVAEREADIAGHLHQQIARRFVEGIACCGVQVECANNYPFAVQRQRGGCGKAGACGTLMPRVGCRVIQEILAPVWLVLPGSSTGRAVPERAIGIGRNTYFVQVAGGITVTGDRLKHAGLGVGETYPRHCHAAILHCCTHGFLK